MRLKTKLKLTTFAAFDNSPGWKTDENGSIAVRDGNPIYIDANGNEMVLRHDAIMSLNNEAKNQRIKKEELENRLKSFDGLDAEKARKAVELVSKLDAKQLIDAGKVDEVKNQITQQFQTQLNEKDSSLKTLQSRLDDMVVNNVFANSEFIRNNVAVPRDMFESYFRNNFKVEDGKISVYGKDGNRLMSKQNVGEYATPEEGLQLLADMHPQKDVILRANPGSGSGNQGGGGARGGGRVVKRADFEKMSPSQQAETAAKAGKGELVLTD